MIQFDDKNLAYTVTILGDRSNYLETIKTLLYMMGRESNSDLSSKDINVMCNLIESMLPDERQIINLDEMKM